MLLVVSNGPGSEKERSEPRRELTPHTETCYSYVRQQYGVRDCDLEPCRPRKKASLGALSMMCQALTVSEHQPPRVKEDPCQRQYPTSSSSFLSSSNLLYCRDFRAADSPT
eukprot:scaffold2353_cov167-Amphora_coffeaeformis.AAC.26